MNKNKKLPDFRLDCMSTSSKLPDYNGLKDANLAAFFSSKERRKLLHRHKLIAKDGVIIENRYQARNFGRSPPIFERRKVAKSASTNKKVKPLSKEKFQELILGIRKKASK